MIYIVPPRRPRRSCGAIGVLEAVTFTLAVAAVIVLAALGNGLPLVAGVVVTLLAVVRGAELPRLHVSGRSMPE
ncbi:hypothetical protein [Amycolatopsis tolypomycina]|uniref:hypothetical protein n=1 Tax=Amycolatopsis tolypomycina TaxID=208445 RepID=UPI0033AC56E6